MWSRSIQDKKQIKSNKKNTMIVLRIVTAWDKVLFGIQNVDLMIPPNMQQMIFSKCKKDSGSQRTCSSMVLFMKHFVDCLSLEFYSVIILRVHEKTEDFIRVWPGIYFTLDSTFDSVRRLYVEYCFYCRMHIISNWIEKKNFISHFAKSKFFSNLFKYF